MSATLAIVRPAIRQPGLSEEGAITAFAVLLLVALMALLGLVVDGGAAFLAHQSAETEAEQAAVGGSRSAVRRGPT